MPAPAVTPTTQRWWDALPGLYRTADAHQPDGADAFPLLRYLSLLGDQADEVAELLERLQLHDGGTGTWTSDLSDPDVAEPGWLPWLAWIIGIRAEVGSGSADTFHQLVLDYANFGAMQADNASFATVRRHGELSAGNGPGPEYLRAAILEATLGRYAGSTGAWERLVQPFLTGARRVIHERIVDGEPWHLRIVTYEAETPDPVVIAYVIGHTELSEGLIVDYATWEGSSFGEVAAGFATFADIVTMFGTFHDLTVWLPPP